LSRSSTRQPSATLAAHARSHLSVSAFFFLSFFLFFSSFSFLSRTFKLSANFRSNCFASDFGLLTLILIFNGPDGEIIRENLIIPSLSSSLLFLDDLKRTIRFAEKFQVEYLILISLMEYSISIAAVDLDIRFQWDVSHYFNRRPAYLSCSLRSMLIGLSKPGQIFLHAA